MTSKTYQFGLLLVVFGGFVSLNRSQFGGLSSLFGELGLIVLFVGVLVGMFGLAVPVRN
jgi:hypothetical protein